MDLSRLPLKRVRFARFVEWRIIEPITTRRRTREVVLWAGRRQELTASLNGIANLVNLRKVVLLKETVEAIRIGGVKILDLVASLVRGVSLETVVCVLPMKKMSLPHQTMANVAVAVGCVLIIRTAGIARFVLFVVRRKKSTKTGSTVLPRPEPREAVVRALGVIERFYR